jgi:hypothetical protein
MGNPLERSHFALGFLDKPLTIPLRCKANRLSVMAVSKENGRVIITITIMRPEAGSSHGYAETPA